MIIARAPVRISFGGGGTDIAAYYERFGGFVVSAAITRYSYVIADESHDGGTHISSADYRVWESFPPGELPPVEGLLRLPHAAVERFAQGLSRRSGVNLFLSSEVPPGTGLGSSSAMAVALVHALATYTDAPLDTPEVADLASWLEIERLGMPIGRQDQYASAFGGVNTITFSAEGVAVTPLDLPAHVLDALDSRLLLFATGRQRDSADILRQQSADSGAKPLVIDRLHRIKALAEEMRTALTAGELDWFGHLLDMAWREKRSLSNKISSSEIDRCYAAAQEAGALGGKITGAGGGGFLLLYCPLEHQATLREAMTEFGLSELPFGFDRDGARVQQAGDERHKVVSDSSDEVFAPRPSTFVLRQRERNNNAQRY